MVIFLGNKGAMTGANNVLFSLAALSGIAILTILRKRSSSLKNIIGLRRVEADCDAEIKEGKDFISQMPDEILVPILALLPTRDSVRTSILSKRWRKLYKYVPHMEFCCLNTFPSEQLDHFSNHKSGNLMKKIIKKFGYKTNCTRSLQEKFINGVDTFLRLHSVSDIVSCCLSCCFITSFPNKLEQWIRTLGRRSGTDVLELNFMCTNNSHEIATFRCGLISLVPSLVHLRLTGCSLQPTPKIKPNRLEVLVLDKVTLTPAAIDCILSNCLNLDFLVMENCTLYSTLRICGSNLQLKHLFIKFCYNIEEIKLWADNLIFFEYFGRKSIEFSFEHVPKLDILILTLTHGLNEENFTPFSCGELAKALPPVSYLTLQIYGQYYEMFTPARFNMFRNIRHLLLGFSMLKPDQLSVALVLEMCPILYELHLQIEKLSSACEGQQGTRSFQFHTQLKKVIFTGFSGTESEMDAALHIVRSATILEKMIVSYCFSYYAGISEWAKDGKVPLREERLEAIERQLGGNAISKDAKVTVRPMYIADFVENFVDGE